MKTYSKLKITLCWDWILIYAASTVNKLSALHLTAAQGWDKNAAVHKNISSKRVKSIHFRAIWPQVHSKNSHQTFVQFLCGSSLICLLHIHNSSTKSINLWSLLPTALLFFWGWVQHNLGYNIKGKFFLYPVNLANGKNPRKFYEHLYKMQNTSELAYLCRWKELLLTRVLTD